MNAMPVSSRWSRPAGVALLAAAAALPAIASNYVIDVGLTIATYSILGLGLNIVVGYAGLLDLGYAAFFAIGAYASAILTTRYGLGFWSAMLVGVLLSTIGGFLVSLVTFRVRGYYLALATLAFAGLVRIVIGHWNGFTGGMMGIRAIPAPALGPWVLDSPLALFYLSGALCCLAVVLYNAIAYSMKGRALMALRDNEMAARASGLGVRQLKIVAFTLSAVFPAVGGSLMAHYYTAITPDLGSIQETVTMLVIVIIGGLGSAAGALFGSAVVNLVPELFRDLGDYRLLAYGLILFGMILYQPQGLFSIGRRLAWRP